jgi:hypothetical protein
LAYAFGEDKCPHSLKKKRQLICWRLLEKMKTCFGGDLKFGIKFGIRFWICIFNLEFWIIWNFEFGLCKFVNQMVIEFWRFGFVLDFADMLTTMIFFFFLTCPHKGRRRENSNL